MNHCELEWVGQHYWILHLPSLWASGDLEERRRIQKMVFPEGIRYNRENDTYQTTRINSLFSLIPQLVRDTGQNKNGICSDKLNKSRLVPGAGIEPARPKTLDFESSASTNSATRAY